MRAIAVLAPLALLATPLAAQVTSPAGYLKTAGNSSNAFGTNMVFQAVDATHLGKVFAAGAVAFRRNATATVTESGGTADITFRMGDGVPLSHIFGDLDKNYLATPKTFYSKTKVSFPDWTKKPTTSPAPFDFKLALSSKFVYVGKNTLTWDLSFKNAISKNSKVPNHAFDSVRVTASTGSSKDLKGGCGLLTQAALASTFGSGSKKLGFSILMLGSGKVPNGSPILMSVDTKTSNLNLGWCSPLLAFPSYIFPMGTIQLGWLPSNTFTAPYLKQFELLTLTTQMVANDASNNITLSNGLTIQLPKAGATNSIDVVSQFQVPPIAGAILSISSSSAIMELAAN